jgi:hypothetical protein
LEPLNAYLATLAVRAPFAEHTLDALDLEVRRTVRERRPAPETASPTKETA